jgi:hypothetical protein
MSDYGEHLRAKLAKLAASPTVAEPGYDATLSEFVRGLNEANFDFQATILPPVPTPQNRSIATRPRYRHGEWTSLLSLWIEGPRIHVVGGTNGKMSSTDELKSFLDDFLDGPIFRETIETYREIAQEPVPAFLRTRGAFASAPEDVLVHVAPDDQRRLALAKPGEALALEVVAQRFPGAGIYDAKLTYRALESAGFALEQMQHSPRSGEVVAVTGVVVPDAEALAAE